MTDKYMVHILILYMVGVIIATIKIDFYYSRITKDNTYKINNYTILTLLSWLGSIIISYYILKELINKR